MSRVIISQIFYKSGKYTQRATFAAPGVRFTKRYESTVRSSGMYASSESFVEHPELVDTPRTVDELTAGQGYYLLKSMFRNAEITEAKGTIMREIAKGGPTATHFHGSGESRPDLQARTWNLLNKGEIFEKMVQHPVILEIAQNILGDDCQLGSIAANTLYPGSTGQEPHIDYPYWDYYQKPHWPCSPKHKDIPFHMCFMATVMLDDFTVQNGATALIPYTQTEARWPDRDRFYEKAIQCEGQAGDVLLFAGLLQHASMPNKSDASRTGVLIQYLPKYVRPMEDQKGQVRQEVLDRATPALRKLLLLDYPYPAVMDQLEPTNSEGSSSDFKWK